MIPNEWFCIKKKKKLSSAISNFHELILAVLYYLIFR